MITVATYDDTLNVDGDLSMTLENLQALLEIDTSIPAASQALFCNGNILTGAQATLESLGVKNDDLILLQRSEAGSPSGSGSGTAAGAPAGAGTEPGSSDTLGGHEREAEALRQQMLSDPHTMDQLRASRPDIAQAVQAGGRQFTEMLRAEQERRAAAYSEQMQLASADEFDIDAQRRIEEAIRQEAVMENFGSAMEFNPESFGRVTMLYVDTEVNGQPVKAFVDSGAQATIMSPECAERCGIMRLLDRRFAGIARGVGTAKILGRVHSAQIKLGDNLWLPCSFTIMEGRATELLFGLDMLKRHACVLDMAKNALVVHGRNIRFLDEHELPASARMDGAEDEPEGGTEGGGAPATGHAADTANANSAAAAARGGQSFPGSGHTLSSGGPASDSSAAAGGRAAVPETGSAPRPVPASTGMSWNHPAEPAATRQDADGSSGGTAGAKAWPSESIAALKDLGATEAQARSFLDAAGGNVEVAASLLFQQ